MERLAEHQETCKLHAKSVMAALATTTAAVPTSCLVLGSR